MLKREISNISLSSLLLPPFLSEPRLRPPHFSMKALTFLNLPLGGSCSLYPARLPRAYSMPPVEALALTLLPIPSPNDMYGICFIPLRYL